MLVRDAMSTLVLTVRSPDTLRRAARLMSDHCVGAVVVLDAEADDEDRVLGILTERDILHAVGSGRDPGAEPAGPHTTTEVVCAAPAWPLERAAEAMTRGGFRHLVVLDGHRPVGIVSLRDILRCWAPSGRRHADLSG
ncbi:cyclic nucleotide-binding/CBS domain-containing protein [Streptomyces sp. NPDC057499]|uniref:CBS domain-containing protein n=1 Tax=Streptomyces sp. NPDC057499 TaxID=3346150 RepID=UPI0036892190